MPSHVTTLTPSHAFLFEDLSIFLLEESIVSRRMGIEEALIDVEGLLTVALSTKGQALRYYKGKLNYRGELISIIRGFQGAYSHLGHP